MRTSRRCSIVLALLVCSTSGLFGQDDSLFTTVKIRRGETLAGLFGKNWELVSRINRIEPRALKVGMTLRIPRDFEWAKTYSPAPDSLPQTSHLRRFILVNLGEQYLATYERGLRVAWYPISSGMNPRQTPHRYIKAVVRFDSIQSGRIYRDSLPDLSTPAGLYKVMWKDSTHVSNTFLTADSLGAPMPWGLMFRNGYWTHGTNNKPSGLPGYPASHGCVRMFDKDAEALYRWARNRNFVAVVRGAEEIPNLLQTLPPDSTKKKTP